MDITELFARPDDPSSLSPEERITVATLDSIAEHGLDGATVRVIAAKAGLNAAAVNYYYRSKDRLVEAALRGAWTHVAEDLDRIVAEASSMEEGLAVATRFLIEGAWRYPRLIRAMLVEHAVLREEAALFIRDIYRRFPEGKEGGGNDLGSVLLMGFCILSGFTGDSLAGIAGHDLSSPEGRERLSTDLAARLFGAR
jgi:AcrR family transcriptional regulator